jgi:hypothetical protein
MGGIMTVSEYNEVVLDQVKRAMDLAEAKRADYAVAGDVLDNFKTVGKLLGVDPLTVWGVYAAKHMIAILKHAGGQELQSEGIEGRLDDLFNYVLLGKALIVEAANEAHAADVEAEGHDEAEDKASATPAPEKTNAFAELLGWAKAKAAEN